MDEDSKREAMASFAAAADAYRASDVHREGEDLDLLVEWCEDADRALDVACGPGHVTGALADAGVSTVIAADATSEMARTAAASFDAPGVIADAERLPFDAGAFDAVTCRIAAHHFPHPRAFVREVRRVLADGGTFAFEDNVAPEDDELAEFFNRFERLRDSSHVEALSRSAWEEVIREAGFEVGRTAVVRREFDYESWVERTHPSADARAVLDELVREPEAEQVYGASVADGEVRGFGNRKVLIRAR